MKSITVKSESGISAKIETDDNGNSTVSFTHPKAGKVSSCTGRKLKTKGKTTGVGFTFSGKPGILGMGTLARADLNRYFDSLPAPKVGKGVGLESAPTFLMVDRDNTPCGD